MPLEAVAYTEVLTRNTGPWLPCLTDLGYRPSGLYVSSKDRRATQMRRGPSTVLLTEVHQDHPSAAAVWLAQHGEGVADVAFFVDHVDTAFDRAIAGGAVPLQSPDRVDVLHLVEAGLAMVGGFPGTGGIRHTLWQAPSGPPRPWNDHAGVAVDPAALDEAAQFYIRVFGLIREPGPDGGPGAPDQVILRGPRITLTLCAVRRNGDDLPYGRYGGPWPPWWQSEPAQTGARLN